jgi:hypothetical protein
MLSKACLRFAAIATIIIAGGQTVRADDAKQPVLNLTAEQWREDLQFLARELPKHHANAFHHISRERFEAAVAELNERLDGMDGDEVYVGLNRLASMIGDAHTFVRFPPNIAKLPLNIGRFGDEVRVTSVTPDFEKALGTRVVKIQDTPVAKAFKTLLAMTPEDETPELARARCSNFLTIGMVLHGFKIIPDRKKARLTLTDDSGKEFSIEVHALAADAKPQWITVYKEPPLFRQKPAENFWYTYLADSRTVFCSFRGYNGLGKVAPGLFKMIEEKQPDKLVIDMRLNGGGDFTLGLKHLVQPIRELAGINQKGHLFVLVGANTFSAAMSNAAHFRAQTAALLVGQTIGEKPNSYQEGRQMTLPNSHLVLNYSVRLYKFVETGDNIIRPDKVIIPTWDEFKAGKDPVLDWVLKYKLN